MIDPGEDPGAGEGRGVGAREEGQNDRAVEDRVVCDEGLAFSATERANQPVLVDMRQPGEARLSLAHRLADHFFFTRGQCGHYRRTAQATRVRS